MSYRESCIMQELYVGFKMSKVEHRLNWVRTYGAVVVWATLCLHVAQCELTHKCDDLLVDLFLDSLWNSCKTRTSLGYYTSSKVSPTMLIRRRLPCLSLA